LSRAITVLLMTALLLTACTSTQRLPQPGRVQWHRTAYSETGQKQSVERLTVEQNENPSQPTVINMAADKSVTIGQSHKPDKADIGAINSRRDLTYAGIGALALAALLAAFGQHWRLAGISATTGLGLIAIGATIDRYAWAYGLALLSIAAAYGAYLWSRYKTRIKNEDV